MLSKIKRQARSQRLHVLLMERGQTTNYQLYSVVSVKRWNVPGFQTSNFFFNFIQLLLISNLCPAPYNKEHSTVSSFCSREKAEEAPYSWLPKWLLGWCQLSHPSCRGLRPAPLPALLQAEGCCRWERDESQGRGSHCCWESTLLGLRTAPGLRIGLDVTTAGIQKNGT